MKILGSFPPPLDSWRTTRWSVVADLGAPERAVAERAWEALLEAYRDPMERYVRGLLRRLAPGSDVTHDAEEVLQGFLADCVEKGWLSRATPERGRFRAFLQTLLKRRVWRHHQNRTAQRRHPGPGRAVVPIPDDPDEVLGLLDDSAERSEFDAAWVAVIVERALRRLEAKHERYGLVIRDLLLTHGEGSPDLPQRLAAKPAQFAVVKHRARQLYARCFAEELAATVDDASGYEEEWRSLASLLP